MSSTTCPTSDIIHCPRASLKYLLIDVKLFCTIATYKGRYEENNKLWHASFDISKASQIVLRDNAAAGSERIGFHIRGESCYGDNPEERWEANTAHTTLHGIHIGYTDGLPGCLKISNFVVWKSWDFGVFGYPDSRVVVQNTVVADNNVGKVALLGRKKKTLFGIDKIAFFMNCFSFLWSFQRVFSFY